MQYNKTSRDFLQTSTQIDIWNLSLNYFSKSGKKYEKGETGFIVETTTVPISHDNFRSGFVKNNRRKLGKEKGKKDEKEECK